MGIVKRVVDGIRSLIGADGKHAPPALEKPAAEKAVVSEEKAKEALAGAQMGAPEKTVVEKPAPEKEPEPKAAAETTAGKKEKISGAKPARAAKKIVKKKKVVGGKKSKAKKHGKTSIKRGKISGAGKKAPEREHAKASRASQVHAKHGLPLPTNGLGSKKNFGNVSFAQSVAGERVAGKKKKIALKARKSASRKRDEAAHGRARVVRVGPGKQVTIITGQAIVKEAPGAIAGSGAVIEKAAGEPAGRGSGETAAGGDIDAQIEETKAMMDFLEQSYLQRKIDEQTFRKKMEEYQEKLHILALKKKGVLKEGEEKAGKTASAAAATEKVVEKTVETVLKKQGEALEKIARERGAVAVEKAVASQKINRFLVEKAGGKINEKKLLELEDKINYLIGKYNISENEVERRLQNTGPADLVESMGKLASLMELEMRTKAQLEKAEKIQTAFPVKEPGKQAEEVIGIATEIKKHRIVTDFDRVMGLVKERGRVKFGQVAKELGIPIKRVDECCRLLQEEKQIEISYPPIGDPAAMSMDYRQREELQRIKKRIEKQKGGKNA